ncbi:MAG: hypothetical protein N2645_07425 [Clostridia bacterium]|nr:hypothetical protein [Clostridia bacterium]
MFWQIRYQTGELNDVVHEMKKGNTPCIDVVDVDEFHWLVGELAKKGVYHIEGSPLDKNARDMLKEPEFEFRAAFSEKPAQWESVDRSNIMFIDIYFEPEIEETYDSIYGD